jgi:ribosome recycling factor
LHKAELDEDTQDRMEKDIQKLIDQAIEKLELILSEKEKELTAI